MSLLLAYGSVGRPYSEALPYFARGEIDGHLKISQINMANQLNFTRLARTRLGQTTPILEVQHLTFTRHPSAQRITYLPSSLLPIVINIPQQKEDRHSLHCISILSIH